MDKKNILMAAAIMFGIVAFYEVSLLIRGDYFLEKALLVFALLMFAVACYKGLDNNMLLLLTSAVYLVQSIISLLAVLIEGYEVVLSDFLLIAGAAVLFYIVFELYKGNYGPADKLAILPALLVLGSFIYFDIRFGTNGLKFYDYVIYLEPVALFLMCSYLKEN